MQKMERRKNEMRLEWENEGCTWVDPYRAQSYDGCYLLSAPMAAGR